MLNTVVLIGRLTRDPDLRYTTQGTAVTTFGIAVDKRSKNENSQKTADFFNIVCWNRLAEVVAQYLIKGRLIAIQGRLQSRSVDRDGSRRIYIEVVAKTVRFLEHSNNLPPKPNSNSNVQQGYFGQVEDDDDLPF